MVRVGVCGITGSQGGAVSKILLENNCEVVGLTRNLDTDTSQDLINSGVNLIKGDFDYPNTLVGVFDGCDAVFIVTDFWEHLDPLREFEQGRNVATSAINSNVKHIIWSTLEDTRNYSDDIEYLGVYKVPHFDEKGLVSRYLKKLDTNVNITYLHTSFFYENFLGTMKLNQDEDGIRRIYLPMNDSLLPMVTVEDIGKMVYKVIIDEIYGDIGVASEHLKISEIAEIMTETLEEEVQYVNINADEYRALGFPGCEDLGNMFEFKDVHNEEFCNMRSMETVRNLIEPTSFRDWCLNNRNNLL